MRVVGGRWRGRPIEGPSSQAIRPTSDRLRESLFNILSHGHGDPVPDARVLDLFAGTGALGLEALSRGAASALFVDLSAESAALIGRNLATLGAGGSARTLRRDAGRLGILREEPFTLAFCDPPYGRGLAEAALLSGLGGGWFAADALVVVEEAATSRFAFPAGFVELDRRRVGGTELAFARLGEGDAATPRPPAAGRGRG